MTIQEQKDEQQS